jgi:hypothetical protein
VRNSDAMYATGTYTLIGDMNREAVVAPPALLNVDLALHVADMHSCPVIQLEYLDIL